MNKITGYTFPYPSIVDRIVINCNILVPGMTSGGEQKFRALWDTGATNTCISTDLAKSLGLTKIDSKQVIGANDEPFWADLYCVTVEMGNFSVEYLNVFALPMDNNNNDVIIGMDIISKGDLSITNHDGKTVLSFREPSLETIDFVSEMDDYNKILKIRESNLKHHLKDKCPCGSGKDFKNCHWKSIYNGNKPQEK